jgi:hypothetical protein
VGLLWEFGPQRLGVPDFHRQDQVGAGQVRSSTIVARWSAEIQTLAPGDTRRYSAKPPRGSIAHVPAERRSSPSIPALP